MPQPVRTNGQAGSVLAGVLGLSLVMAMAAGSYLLISGVSASKRYDVMDEERLRSAAEAGLYLGLGWIKQHDESYVKQRKWTGTVPLTSAGFRLAQPTETGSDSIRHEVSILLLQLLDADGNPTGKYQLRSQATLGAHHDTLLVSLLIDSLVNTGAGSSKPYTDSLAESYIPGNP